MDCSEDTDREMMKRTVALLLSFARIAEGIATRSYLVRCVMLWILRRAKISAQRYVIGAEAPDPFVLQRNAPAEALRLAQTFRELASMLKDALHEHQRFARLWTGGKSAEEPEPEPSRPTTRPRLTLRLHTLMQSLGAFAPTASRVLAPP